MLLKVMDFNFSISLSAIMLFEYLHIVSKYTIHYLNTKLDYSATSSQPQLITDENDVDFINSLMPDWWNLPSQFTIPLLAFKNSLYGNAYYHIASFVGISRNNGYIIFESAINNAAFKLVFQIANDGIKFYKS